jgi:hypothetical protein
MATARKGSLNVITGTKKTTYTLVSKEGVGQSGNLFTRSIFVDEK